MESIDLFGYGYAIEGSSDIGKVTSHIKMTIVKAVISLTPWVID
jgi:hypothetical protein